VGQTLKTLQTNGIVLSIVTYAPKTKAYQRLLLMDIEHCFKFVVGYEDTQKPKQTGLPFQLAIKQLKKEIPGIHESEILMVGDSMNRDLTPAKQLGLKTALALYGRVTGEDGEPDYELADIRDLSKITQTYNNSAQ
jgi:putative hydrolase of the HAD superfamily